MKRQHHRNATFVQELSIVFWESDTSLCYHSTHIVWMWTADSEANTEVRQSCITIMFPLAVSSPNNIY